MGSGVRPDRPEVLRQVRRSDLGRPWATLLDEGFYAAPCNATVSAGLPARRLGRPPGLTSPPCQIAPAGPQHHRRRLPAPLGRIPGAAQLPADRARRAGQNVVGFVNPTWPHCDGLTWPHDHRCQVGWHCRSWWSRLREPTAAAAMQGARRAGRRLRSRRCRPGAPTRQVRLSSRPVCPGMSKPAGTRLRNS